MNSEKLAIPPHLEKRGKCLFIQGAYTAYELVVKKIRPILEGKGTISQAEPIELTDEQFFKIAKELASYIYYEIAARIWEYKWGDLNDNDAQKVLDFAAREFVQSFHIQNINKKLDEYRQAHNHLYCASTNIMEIAGNKDDVGELMESFITIAAGIKFVLTERMKATFKMTEKEMTELIEAFYSNIFPKLFPWNKVTE